MAEVVAPSGAKEHGWGLEEIVSKPTYYTLFCVVLIIVHVHCSNYDQGYIKKQFQHPPWTPHQTQRSLPMGHATHRPCPIKMSDVVVKCHWYVGIVFWFRGKAMVNYHQGIHTLSCILNILKH